MPDALLPYATEFVCAGAKYTVDSMVLAGICWRESRGGTADACHPKGPACLGDGGHGHGLMQVDDRSHPDFCRDPALWADPHNNICKGASILRENLDFFALRKDPDALFCAVAAYNCGAGNVLKAIRALPADVDLAARRRAIDARTAAPTFDYARYVLNHAQAFRPTSA